MMNIYYCNIHFSVFMSPVTFELVSQPLNWMFVVLESFGSFPEESGICHYVMIRACLLITIFNECHVL